MYCYELMKIPSFKDIKLIAGESGLNRKVSWVYVLQTPSLENWVYGGEILFIVNAEDLCKTIEDAISHEISCAVVLKNKQNQSVLTDRILKLADREDFPLFEMDYNIKLIDVTREISTCIVHKQEKLDYLNYFFHKILLTEPLKDEDMEEFSVNYGFHSDHHFFIATIQTKEIHRLSTLKNMFHIYIAEENVRFLSTIMNGRLVFLGFASSSHMDKAKQILKTSFSLVDEKYHGEMFMGIGSRCNSLRDVHYSYMKSIKALSLCTLEKQITDYEELGFSRLLLNTIDARELKDYASHILGAFKEYDAANQTSFLSTLESYVLFNGNINKISASLHIHRNTCIYRLAKIREIFRIDLEDPYVRADILNSLSIDHFLKKQHIQFTASSPEAAFPLDLPEKSREQEAFHWIDET